MSSWDSLDSWSNYANCPPENLEDVLYEHFQKHRQDEDPQQLIHRFRQLFIEAKGYSDHDVWSALHLLVQRPGAEREFKYTLNRCCYTLINPWYTQPRTHWAIPELIRLFEELPTQSDSASGVKSVQALVREFTATEQFAALRRLQEIFSEPKTDFSSSVEVVSEQPVGKRIRHYPFLYDHSLLTKDSSQEQKQNIQDLRRKIESDLGVNLVRYHHYCKGLSLSKQPAKPTLLADSELLQALESYTGKVDGYRTQRDMAKWFETYSQTVRSFRDFKEEFVEYLIGPIASVEPKYANNHFTRRLRQYLQETLSEFDGQRLNSFMLVETCRKVLNFLVVDSPHRPVFRNFLHLLNDIGYVLTTGLLLRVVLFCSAAKPWLERCFSVLFHLHERHACKQVPWLVNSLEHTNVALITNFGGVGFQF